MRFHFIISLLATLSAVAIVFAPPWVGAIATGVTLLLFGYSVHEIL